MNTAPSPKPGRLSRLLPVAYAIEAVLCGGPITALALFVTPQLMGATFNLLTSFNRSSSPFLSFLWELPTLLMLAGWALALVSFWRLAIATVAGRRFRFGVVFYLSVAGAVSGVMEFSGHLARVDIKALLFVAPACCALHFVYLQRRRMPASQDQPTA